MSTRSGSTSLTRLIVPTSLGIFVAVVLFWHLMVVIGGIPEFLLPTPGQIAQQLWSMIEDGRLIYHSGITGGTILTGFVLGSLLGFLVGYLLSQARSLEYAFFPYIMLIQATPKVSFIPLFVIWFGIGITSKMLIIVLSAFFPVLMNTITGFRSVEREYHELMYILRATNKQKLLKVEIPLSLPFIMAGLKVGMVQAVIGAIVSEWISGTNGLGYLLVYGSTQYDARLLIASIIATSLLGVALYLIIDFAERRLLFWHESQQTQGT